MHRKDVQCDNPSHAFELTIDIVAQLVAAHVSGIKDAQPAESDKAIAAKMLTTMERELFARGMGAELPADPVEFAVNNPEMRDYLTNNRLVQAIKVLRATYPGLGLLDGKNFCDQARIVINRETLEHVDRTARGLD